MALTDLVRRTWSQRQSLAARGGVDECLSYAREEGYEPDETFLHAIVLCLFSGDDCQVYVVRVDSTRKSIGGRVH